LAIRKKRISKKERERAREKDTYWIVLDKILFVNLRITVV
jgi:hypothetical protein